MLPRHAPPASPTYSSMAKSLTPVCNNAIAAHNPEVPALTAATPDGVSSSSGPRDLSRLVDVGLSAAAQSGKGL
jgi:hypothetical protein